MNPAHPQHSELRKKYGEDAWIVLFFDDPAVRAAEMYGLDLKITEKIEDHELPDDLADIVVMDHYFRLH